MLQLSERQKAIFTVCTMLDGTDAARSKNGRYLVQNTEENRNKISRVFHSKRYFGKNSEEPIWFALQDVEKQVAEAIGNWIILENDAAIQVFDTKRS